MNFHYQLALMATNPRTSEMGANKPSTSNKVPLENFDGDGIDYSGHFITSEIFETDLEAIDWAKKIAIKIGFKLVISSHKDSGKFLRCSRGERYRGVLRNLDAAIRKNTKTKACECKFQIKVQQLQGCSSWVVCVVPGKGMHNHALVVYPDQYRQECKLSPASKKIVRDMSIAEAKPSAILAAIQEKNPKDNPTSRHVYNYRDYLRRIAFEDRDVVGQLFHLAMENKYVHWTLADPDTNVLTHIFMAHPESVNLLRTYYWYIGIGSTYKINRYKMPFLEIVGMTPCNKNFIIAYVIMKDETESSYRWMLEKLRCLIGFNVHPTTIVTNRNLELMMPVREIFPQTAHFLCTWHINKDVEEIVNRICGKDSCIAEGFKNDKWKKIMEAPTKVEYDQAVGQMNDDMKHFPQIVSYINETWLVYKEMFVAAWTSNVVHFGITSISRVEKEHTRLKHCLSSSTSTLDTVWTKVNKEIDSQLAQIRCTLEESRRNLGLSYYGFPINYLVCHVSHYCLRLLTDELVRMRGLGDEVYDRCGCVLRSTHQIPCACELRRAMDLKMPITVECLHLFWRTLVISGPKDKSEFFNSEEYRKFQSLVDKVYASDTTVVRKISLLIHDQLYPAQAGYQEPEVKTTNKGQSNGSMSTKRSSSMFNENESGRGLARSRFSNSFFNFGDSTSSCVQSATTTDRNVADRNSMSTLRG